MDSILPMDQRLQNTTMLKRLYYVFFNPQVPEGNRILFATTITQLYKTDGSSSEAVACGAAGVALIEESPRNISLVVYDRKKTPFFRLVIGKVSRLVSLDLSPIQSAMCCSLHCVANDC
jgi:hypothetical protein